MQSASSTSLETSESQTALPHRTGHRGEEDDEDSSVTSSSNHLSAADRPSSTTVLQDVRAALRFCQLQPNAVSPRGLESILFGIVGLASCQESPSLTSATLLQHDESNTNPFDIQRRQRRAVLSVEVECLRRIGRALHGVRFPQIEPLVAKLQSLAPSDFVEVATLAEQAVDEVRDHPDYEEVIDVYELLTPFSNPIIIDRALSAASVTAAFVDLTMVLGSLTIVCLVVVFSCWLALIPSIVGLLLSISGGVLKHFSHAPGLAFSSFAVASGALCMSHAVVVCIYASSSIRVGSFPLSLIPASLAAYYTVSLIALPSCYVTTVFRTESGSRIRFYRVFYASVMLSALVLVMVSYVWRQVIETDTTTIVGELLVIVVLVLHSLSGMEREAAGAAARRGELELLMNVVRLAEPTPLRSPVIVQNHQNHPDEHGPPKSRQVQAFIAAALSPAPRPTAAEEQNSAISEDLELLVAAAPRIPSNRNRPSQLRLSVPPAAMQRKNSADDGTMSDSTLNSDVTPAHRRSTFLAPVVVTSDVSPGGESIIPVLLSGGTRPADWRVPFEEIGNSNLIFAIDSAGEVVYWSGGLEQLTHFMRKDVIGQSILSVVPRPSDQRAIVSASQNALRAGVCLELTEVELMSRTAGRGVTSVAFAAYAARNTVNNSGVFFLGAHAAANILSEVSEALADLQMKIAATSSTMSQPEREMLGEYISRMQRALPVDLAEVSVPEAIGRMICTQFSNTVIVSQFATDFPLTLPLEADSFQVIVQQVLQYYTRRGGIALDAFVETASGRPTLRIVPDTPCAPWEPTVSANVALRKCRCVLSFGNGDELRGGCRLAFPADEDRRRSSSHHNVPDAVRCSVLLHDSNTITGTLVRRIVWERNHALFFVSDTAKLLMTLDGVDILFLRVTAAMGAGFVSTICAAKPDLQIVAICQGVRIKTIPNVYLLEDPVLSQDIHNVLTECTRSVTERRKSEKTVSDIRATLSSAKSCPWVRGKLLGRGANATVYEATNVITKGKMAVRELRLDTSDPDELRSTINAIVEEVKLMSALEHPNIINYLYLERSETGLNIFMEYAPGGSIRSWLDKKGPAPLPQVALWLQDILEGLQYLHAQGVVHRDIKAANVLIAANGTCKLSDFGTARKLSAGSTATVEQAAGGAVGTLLFMSPEVVKNQPHDWHTDIWSLGCMVMEMLTGRMPFAHCIDSPLAAVRFLASMRPDDVVSIPSAITDLNAVSFLLCCLSVDPAHRPNCSTLLNHPLLLQAARSRVATAASTTATTIASSTMARSARRVGKVVTASNLCVDEDDYDSRRASAFSESSKSRASFAVGRAGSL